MFELVRDVALKILGHVAPFALARFYPAEKISSHLRFRVRGEGDGVTYEGGELPKIHIWMQVSNLSPFNVEIDRMVVQVTYGAPIAEIVDVRRRSVPSSTEAEWLIECVLNEKQVAYIQRNSVHNPETRLNLCAFVNTTLHEFESAMSVGTGNVRLLNIRV